MRIIAKANFQLALLAVLFLGNSFLGWAQSQESGDITSGTSVFVFKAPKRVKASFNPQNDVKKPAPPRAGAGTKKPASVSDGRKSQGQATIVKEPIAPEKWINENAPAAIEERAASDSEPFLSLSEGYLNSRFRFCASPPFPEAARRAKQKLVQSKVLITVAKYGGVLEAETLEGDASFRTAVYETLGSMQFRVSSFMGQPIRIEGLASFAQNPANSLICRDASQEVELPAMIEGGVLNERVKNCESPDFPAAAKSAGLKSVTAKIQVIVDEKGNVISAKPLGGDESFRETAAQAAMKWTFPISYITEKLVKVRGELILTQTPNNNSSCKNNPAE